MSKTKDRGVFFFKVKQAFISSLVYSVSSNAPKAGLPTGNELKRRGRRNNLALFFRTCAAHLMYSVYFSVILYYHAVISSKLS